MSSSAIPIPAPILSLFSKFPLHTHPPVPSHGEQNTNSKSLATLWINPPKPDIILPQSNFLSADVECLKWQAYLALRLGDRMQQDARSLSHGVLAVRWDIAEEGAVDGRLPSLQTNDRKLLGARAIPGWVDKILGDESADAFEGYRDGSLRDESRAWVALLEGVVHAALTLSKPSSPTLYGCLFHGLSAFSPPSLASSATPPPAPSSGLTALFPPFGGERISITSVQTPYRDAILALSDRLGSEKWFLGSERPTPLDALVFAYLHCLMDGPDTVRTDVVRRANLVAWERRVRVIVQMAFARDEKQ